MDPARRGTRVGFASPNWADAELAVRLLAQSGIEALPFSSLPELAAALSEDIGCLVLVEEALTPQAIPALSMGLARLPTWWDLPLVVVASDTGRVGDAVAEVFPSSGNVALLGRPLSPHTLLSAVRVALRASARQCEVGDLMAEREQAVRQRDEFLAMLAHELRNPLAPMRNALHILRAAEADDTRVQMCARILERQVGHMVRLVDDLLDAARLERGKVVLQTQRLDLNGAVASALQHWQTLAHADGPPVTLRLHPQPLPVDVDDVRLEQVLCNLLNNAFKFSARQEAVTVQTYAQPGWAHVSVEDHGVGFDPDDAQHLFDPFVQVNPTLERKAGGLGIGLTVVRRLVELHGGAVEATSAGRGQGARFVVRLPMAMGVDAAPAPQPEAPVKAPRRRSVVVIEDNADIRDTLEILIGMWGHDVALASDGRSGVELVLRNRPQVALIDIGLPGLSGYEVARRIREQVPAEAVRLVAITGYGQAADREQAWRAGFDLHLLKPIDPVLLEKVLAD